MDSSGLSDQFYIAPFFCRQAVEPQANTDRVTRTRACQSSAMSYYNPGQPGTYPYGYTPATYAQTPGSYPSYSYPPTAVTGYGTTWPYYSYVPPQHRMTTTTPSLPRTTATNNTTTSGATRGTSFATTHTPASYADTINAAGGGGNTRTGGLATGTKRQANLKGLFTKECEGSGNRQRNRF